MPGPLVSDDIKGPGAPPDGNGGDSGGGDGEPEGRGSSRRALLTGLVVLVASTVILFASFTIAFGLRRKFSRDWHGAPLPPVLWANTGVLFVSGFVLEFGRRALRMGRRAQFNIYWTAGTILGLLFLFGQALAWHQWNKVAGITAATPASAFFYVLSATHAAHVLAALTALIYVDVQALTLRLGPAKRTAVEVSTWFWHFLAALWFYLMVLFVLWE